MKKSCFYTSLTLGFLLACPAHSQVLITNSYSYTGSSQQISVPLNTASIYFELYGASGGNASGNWTVYGGQGAFVSGNISLSLIGEVPIFLFVGGAAVDSTQIGAAGGFNGGGNGEFGFGGGGGGATDIRIGGVTFGDRVAIAGGGGGANTAGGFGGSGGDAGVVSSVLGLGGSGRYGGGGGGYFGGYYGGSPEGNVSVGQGGSSFVNSSLVQNSQKNVGANGTSTSKANGSAVLVFSVVPEPSSYALILSAIAFLAFIFRGNLLARFR